MTLPRLGTAKGMGMSIRGLRRLSANALKGHCTVLPSLRSVDELLHKEAATTLEQKHVQLMKTADQLANRLWPVPLGHSEDFEPEEISSAWHVMLLGRTFRGKTLQEAAECLADALEIETDAALVKAKTAFGATAMVVSTCSDFKEACQKVQMLRKLGLQVQVASEAGLPSHIGPRPPASKPPKYMRRRASYGEVFDEANPRPRRRSWPNAVQPSVTDERHQSAPIEGEFDVCEEPCETGVLEGDSLKPKRYIRRKSKNKDGLISDRFGDVPTQIKSPSSELEAPFPSTAVSSGKEHVTDCSQGKVDAAITCANDYTKDDVIDDSGAEASENMLTPAKEEASALLRFLLFGEMVRICEASAVSEKEVQPAPYPATQDIVVSKDQVRTFMTWWEALDRDGSQRVDLEEFRRCIEPRLRARFRKLRQEKTLPKWAKMTPYERQANDFQKYTSRLRDRLGGLLFCGRSSFSLEDLMKLTWLHASQADIQTIKNWIHEISSDLLILKRVKTPPVLHPDERQELCAVFKHFDSDKLEALSFDTLVNIGLIDSLQVEKTRRDWDSDNNGILDMEEFCEMMCPLGYRASKHSKVGTLADGRRVILDPSVGHWQVEPVSP